MVQPTRKITNCKNTKKTGYFPSTKMNRTIMFESLLERDYIYLLEFDSNVISYCEQPIKIEYYANNRKYSYTPDFLIERESITQIVEVKPKNKLEKEISNIKKARKYLAADIYCNQNMYEFLFVTDELIRKGNFLKNVKMLFMYSRIEIPYTYRKHIESNLLSLNKVKIGDVLDILANTKDEYVKYKQFLLSLIYCNKIKADMSKKIMDDSIIWI